MKKNKLMYTFLIILAAVGILAIFGVSPILLGSACNGGIIAIVISLLKKSAKERYKDLLFDYDSFCEIYLDKDYDELSDLLIKKGSLNYEHPEPDSKSIDLALLNRLCFLKYLEDE